MNAPAGGDAATALLRAVADLCAGVDLAAVSSRTGIAERDLRLVRAGSTDAPHAALAAMAAACGHAVVAGHARIEAGAPEPRPLDALPGAVAAARADRAAVARARREAFGASAQKAASHLRIGVGAIVAAEDARTNPRTATLAAHLARLGTGLGLVRENGAEAARRDALAAARLRPVPRRAP